MAPVVHDENDEFDDAINDKKNGKIGGILTVLNMYEIDERSPK